MANKRSFETLDILQPLSISERLKAARLSQTTPSESFFILLYFFHAYGLTPNVQYRLKSFEMVRSLVGVGCGFSFGFLPLHNNKTYQGSVLVRRPLQEKLPTPWVCLAYSNQLIPTRIVQAFMQETKRVLTNAFFKRHQR